MNTTTADYRAFLNQKLKHRIEKNPAYSLRAMAKHLGLAPSMLSDVLSGKRNLSLDHAAQIAQALRLPDHELEWFCLSVQIAAVRSPQVRAILSQRMNALLPEVSPIDLSLELFKVISTWYHLAILELTYEDGFEGTPAYVSKRLGISETEADMAMERLLRLELLERLPNGSIHKTKDHIFFGSEAPHQALRRYHTQMLERAIASIEGQSPQEKAIGSETFAFDPALLPEAKSLTQSFLKKMAALASRSQKKTEVYHLSAVLFRITQKRSPQ